MASEADQLLARIEKLKTTAAEHKTVQERALVLEAKARDDLGDLTGKLENLFGTRNWTEAELLLPQLREEAERAIAEVERELEGAGLL